MGGAAPVAPLCLHLADGGERPLDTGAGGVGAADQVPHVQGVDRWERGLGGSGLLVFGRDAGEIAEGGVPELRKGPTVYRRALCLP